MKTPTIRLRSLLVSAIALFSLQALPARAENATFSWWPSTDDTLAGYKILYGTSSHTYTQTIDIGKPERAANGRIYYTVNGLVTGTKYYFTIRAYDSSGTESPDAQEVVITAGKPKPPAPVVTNSGEIN